MKDTLRWAYALNQWNFRLDVFVRHEDQQRALKTMAACGFDHVELASGTGRWDNIARPEVILLNHGSADAFLEFLRGCSVQGVSSMFWDPGQPVEEEGWAFRSTRNRDDHDAIVESAKPFVDFLAAIGAEQLVVRPVGSAWMAPPLSGDDIAAVGAVWNQVGELAAASGLGLALHYDCLGAVHTEDELKQLLAATDPALVGLALDTAEFTIGGIDPVAFYEHNPDRVAHVHLKDTRYADTGEEYRMPGAESTCSRRWRTAHRAVVLRARHRRRPGRRARLRRRTAQPRLPRLGRRRERPRRQSRGASNAQQLVPAARACGGEVMT